MLNGLLVLPFPFWGPITPLNSCSVQDMHHLIQFSRLHDERKQTISSWPELVGDLIFFEWNTTWLIKMTVLLFMFALARHIRSSETTCSPTEVRMTTGSQRDSFSMVRKLVRTPEGLGSVSGPSKLKRY